MAVNDLVTVVIPVYNAKATVEKTVRSILNQTYKNLEIIIVNDGSTDESLSICEKLEAEDSRIVIHTQENGGISAARNTGISLAKGKWITFVDSDDLIDPDMIEILLNSAVNTGADISFCNFKKVDTLELDNASSGLKADEKLLSSTDMINGSLLNEISLFVWGKLYKTVLFKGVESPVGRIYEDEITSLRLFAKSEKTVFTDKVLYFYYQNSTSLTKCPKAKHADDIVANQAEIVDLLKDKDIDKKALYAHLCSNYTLAYNIVWKCSKDKDQLKNLKQKINELYKLTDKKSIKMQPNGTSIILLHLGLYRILLGIRAIIRRQG